MNSILIIPEIDITFTNFKMIGLFSFLHFLQWEYFLSRETQ